MRGASGLTGRLAPVVDRLPLAVMLGGVLLLGAFLRFYQLGFESLWIDEGVSINIADLDPLQMIRQATSDPTPPFYYLILHYWMALFGDSEFSVRSLSAIAGSLSILVMYRLGALLFGRTTGLLAAVILAVSEVQIYYSQEVRVYSLFCLLALISFYFFVKIVQGDTGRVCLAGYVASTVLLMYAHVYGLFVLAAQDFYLLTALLASGKLGVLRPGPGVRTWAMIHGAMAVLYIPGFLFLVGQLMEPRGRAWVQEPGLPLLARLPDYYSGSAPAAFVFVAFAVVGIVKKTRDPHGATFSGRTYMVAVWLLALTVLPFAVSKFSVVVLGHPRHTIGASLAFYLLAAKGLDGLISGAYRRMLAFGAVVIVVALSAPGLWTHYTTLDKPQWREASQYVNTHAERGDLVLYRNGLLFDHYSKREDIDKEHAFNDTPKTVLGEHERVWVLLYGAQTTPKLLESELESSFRVTDREKYRSLKLILFERKVG